MKTNPTPDIESRILDLKLSYAKAQNQKHVAEREREIEVLRASEPEVKPAGVRILEGQIKPALKKRKGGAGYFAKMPKDLALSKVSSDAKAIVALFLSYDKEKNGYDKNGKAVLKDRTHWEFSYKQIETQIGLSDHKAGRAIKELLARNILDYDPGYTFGKAKQKNTYRFKPQEQWNLDEVIVPNDILQTYKSE